MAGAFRAVEYNVLGVDRWAPSGKKWADRDHLIDYRLTHVKTEEVRTRASWYGFQEVGTEAIRTDIQDMLSYGVKGKYLYWHGRNYKAMYFAREIWQHGGLDEVRDVTLPKDSTRSVLTAPLTHKASGKQVYFSVAHLTPSKFMNLISRTVQWKFLADELEKYGDRQVMALDAASGLEFRAYMKTRGWQSAMYASGIVAENKKYKSYNKFMPTELGGQIDHIMVRKGIRVLSAKNHLDHRASDHNQIFAGLEIL